MNIYDILNSCKNSKEIYRVMNIYVAKNYNKYSFYLKKSLAKQNDYNKSLQIAYNYLLNQEIPTKSKDTAYVPYKGTAIGGMECHSAGHR